MTVSRRRFLLSSGTVQGGLAAGTAGEGAEGDSSRLYDSKLEIEQIALRMVLGSGREAWHYVKSLGSAPVLKRTDAGTQVYTSLWADVCIGRRQGPLVRRIAAREIGCREGQFLAETEHEVQVLVNNANESRLSRMIRELIRRIAEGSWQG